MAATSAPSVTRGPTRDTERAPAPDLARGFMLVLIALANTPFYLWASQAGASGTAHPVDGSVADRVTQFLVMTTVDLRVYPMFAFLFGYGMVQLFRRQVSSGTPEGRARRLLQRRNLWLLLFGFVHAALLWMGDVLGAYGLAGLILVGLFFRRRDRTLVVWASVLTGLLVLMVAFSAVGAFFAMQLPPSEAAAMSFSFEEPSIGDPDYLRSIADRLLFWLGLSVGQGLLMLVVPIMILLAFVAARREILERPGQHLRLLRTTAVAGIAVGWLGGLPHALVHVGAWDFPEQISWVFMPLQLFTGLFGGLGYVALFGLLGHRIAISGARPAPTSPAGSVIAVGKRSLSCYLAQSVLCAPVLAAWGLGLGEHMGSFVMALYAVVVWLVTLVLAVWFERTGRRGPAEVLLRRLVYRRAATPAPAPQAGQERPV
ncbi:DUF418 domain-containing protein [Georgenia alba]|uniref:DUF418 domain-containing protein n=1 Tax=Georgenia alba TaxID=2233858 RepID=A0ABW2QE86_9MICO